MKISLLILATFVACSKNENKTVDPEIRSEHHKQKVAQLIQDRKNSDGDMLTDAEEKELGHNPFIADLPSFTLLLHPESHLKWSYFDSQKNQRPIQLILNSDINGGTRNYYLKTLWKWYNKKIAPSSLPYSENNFIVGKKFNQFLVQRLINDLKELKLSPVPHSGQSTIHISKVKVHGVSPLYSFKNLSLRFNFIDFDSNEKVQLNSPENDPITLSGLYERDGENRGGRFHLKNISPKVMTTQILKSSALSANIDDFDIEINEKKESFQNLLNRIRSKSTGFIISTPKLTILKYISSELSLFDAKKELFKQLQDDYPEQLLASDLVVTYPSSVTFENYDNVSDNDSFWASWGSGVDTKGKLIPGQIQYLIYARKKDIQKMAPKQIFSAKHKLEDKVDFNPPEKTKESFFLVNGLNINYSRADYHKNTTDWEMCHDGGPGGIRGTYPCNHRTCSYFYGGLETKQQVHLYKAPFQNTSIYFNHGNGWKHLNQDNRIIESKTYHAPNGKQYLALYISHGGNKFQLKTEPIEEQLQIGYLGHNCRERHNLLDRNHSWWPLKSKQIHSFESFSR